ncbi:MAG: AAA family ATPase, partial [Acidimicrobiia bacterium]|nr:AAA family ATPase [Acidimicrobiia bacterium]
MPKTTNQGAVQRDQPRVVSFTVENFRALKRVHLKDLTPLTVLVGPNGSGKSTVFDVFAFLSECFETGLRQAWDRRGRAKEIRSRGSTGPVVIEIKYREGRTVGGPAGNPLITYHIELDERRGRPVVEHEWLSWKRQSYGRPFKFLDVTRGRGEAASGEVPDESDERVPVRLKSPDLLAVSALGQFTEHPRVVKLRDFIMGWHTSYLSADGTRGQPESGPQENLTRSGDNLSNVVQYLNEN